MGGLALTFTRRTVLIGARPRDVCDPVGMNTNATASSGALPGLSARQTDSYVIAVMNQKGGVGKTMVTLSLAAHTAAANGRALVVDVDPQANAYDLTQLMEDPGYDVVHELDPVELTRIRQLRDYDTILVDCPGSLEGRDVLHQVLARSTYVVIPYPHEPEAVLPTLRTAEKVRSSGIPYGVVVTKADPRLGADFIIDAWSTLETAGIRHFRSVIREYRAWPNSLKAGVPITRWNERYAPKIREDIASLHTELLLDIGRRVPAGSV
jgi:chromosome partitioning protein